MTDLVGLNEYGKPPELKPPPKEPSTFETIILPSTEKRRKTVKFAMPRKRKNLGFIPTVVLLSAMFTCTALQVKIASIFGTAKTIIISLEYL